MKIIEAITRIDSLKHNTYSRDDKIAWLSELDEKVKTEIIDTHYGANKEIVIEEYILENAREHKKAVMEYMKIHNVTREEAEKNVVFHPISYKDAKEHIEATRNDIMFAGYDENTDIQTELLIPSPYAKAYLLWMEAWIDYYNGEHDSYNNAMAMFNAEYEAFQKHYTKQHMPKQSGKRFLF